MIFYCESRIFSGQERMFLTAACAVSFKKECILVINEANENAIKFSEVNGDFKEIKLISNFEQKFSSFVIWFRWKRIFTLYQYFKGKKKKHLDICVSQGRIESGNIGILAAKISGLNIISYIPMVHNHVEMEPEKLSSKIKDILCFPLYKLPNSFITISEEVADELMVKCNVQVKVVENFSQRKLATKIINAPLHFYDKSYYKILLPGRLLNKQKGQLDLIKAISTLDNKLKGRMVCYIVGDGPDKDLIQNKINELDLNDTVFVLGNRTDLLSLMEGSDLIVLPSIFEGVPLVLLEAALLNKDIIASDIVGFKNYLSKDDVFPPKDPESLANKIASKMQDITIKAKYSNDLEQLLLRNDEIFKADFYKALDDLS